MLDLLYKIRFAGGPLDGKRGADQAKPETVRWVDSDGMSIYVHTSTDDDGTLVYRKK